MSLGKRKRPMTETKTKRESPSDGEDNEDLRARFQKAFEAKFKPLPKHERKAESTELQDDEDHDSEDSDESRDDGNWEGFSEDEVVEVVQHEGGQEIDRQARKRELKAFMSSKPPSSSLEVRPSSKKESAATADDDDTEAANLKNDLALQRLLKESHLLDPASFSKSSSTVPEGKARIKALELRLQDIGAKKALEKMPMAHRKGIHAKADKREKSRRKEAAENGIILERATAPPKKTARHRERGIGAPSIGKFQGGTLKLSGKDLKSIKGAGKKTAGGRRR